MKKAENLSEIAQAFGPEPLDGKENIEQFFCETMSVRTGDKYMSPLDDLFEDCLHPCESNAYLLLGHKGCGKSTELNRLMGRLENEGHKVAMIRCTKDADIFNIVYWDLLILISESLCNIAKELECDLPEYLLRKIADYWNEVESIREIWDSHQIAGEAGVGGKATLLGLLNFFARLKGEIKYAANGRKVIREQIKKRPAEWIDYMKTIIDCLTEKSGHKQPVIIVEDLDKIEPETAKELFLNTPLAQLPFPTIFTFPISLFYAPMFAGLEGFYRIKVLPMIKINTPEGESFNKGIEIIEEIVGKRANLDLFERDALTLLIKKTGGCLRDLFSIIFNAARRAERRNSNRIEQEDVQTALINLRSTLTRRIEKKQYEFLATIHKGKKNREEITDQKMLLEMLQGMIMLEYNGARWHDLHPLILDFLKEQGYIDGIG